MNDFRHEYSSIIAAHYAAYRPPLHEIILRAALTNSSYNLGLDIGCGTGHSAMALSQYCKKVTGVEPSHDMLRKVISHPKITYLHFDGTHLPFPDANFDVITFAGSLYYAKSLSMLNEVIRISKRLSTVLVYDFDVLLDDIYYGLDVSLLKENESYDHQIDFSGLEQKALKSVEKVNKTIHFQIRPTHLAHLLLASKNSRETFGSKFQLSDPFPTLENELMVMSKKEKISLTVNTFYTKYYCFKET